MKKLLLILAIAICALGCTSTRYISVDDRTGDTTYYDRQYNYGGIYYNDPYSYFWGGPYYYNYNYRPYYYIPIYHKQPVYHKPIIKPTTPSRRIQLTQPVIRPSERPALAPNTSNTNVIYNRRK